jgi:hypothetical protein
MSGTTITIPFGKLTVRKLVGELVALWPSWSGTVTSHSGVLLTKIQTRCWIIRDDTATGPRPLSVFRHRDFTRLPLRTWSIGAVRQSREGYSFVPADNMEKQRVLALLPAQGGR